MALNFQQTNALSLLQHRLDQLDTQDSNLDQKAQNNIQAITIIFAFAAAFKLFEPASLARNTVLVAAIFIVYTLSVLSSYYVLLPKRWAHLLGAIPSSDIEALTADASTYYVRLLAAFRRVIARNHSIVELKSRIVWFSTALIIVDIGLIIYLAAK